MTLCHGSHEPKRTTGWLARHLSVSEDLLSSLSYYAVRVRYPGDDPTIEEAKEALTTARAVRRFARKWLGVR
jgi:HEPN domain-containing protein